MKDRKAIFAAIPLRAVSDKRLSTLHFRALGMIAHHDRMSGSRGAGQGCWAGVKRLAEEIVCNRPNLSAAINDLMRWGYLDCEENPSDRKRRVYRVNYDLLPTGNLSPSDKGNDLLPTGNLSPSDKGNELLPTGNLSVARTGSIGCPLETQASEPIKRSDPKYILKDNQKEKDSSSLSQEGKKLRKAEEKVESAIESPTIDRAKLVRWDRDLQSVRQSPRTASRDELNVIVQSLEWYFANFGCEHPLHRLAERVLDEAIRLRVQVRSFEHVPTRTSILRLIDK